MYMCVRGIDFVSQTVSMIYQLNFGWCGISFSFSFLLILTNHCIQSGHKIIKKNYQYWSLLAFFHPILSQKPQELDQIC